MKSTPDTHMGGAERNFPPTAWSMILHAREPRAPEFREAVETLVANYWKPVYCLIRRTWNVGNEDAKELTQEFFVTTVLEGSLVEKFAPERGSFRGFLKAALTNFLRDEYKNAGRIKRGGRALHLSMDHPDFNGDEVIGDAGTIDPSAAFDTDWKRAVLAQAVELLEKRLAAENKAVYFEVFRRLVLDPEGTEPSYSKVGEELKLSVTTVKNHVTRARERFRQAVRDVVSGYVDSDADLTDEIHALFAD